MAYKTRSELRDELAVLSKANQKLLRLVDALSDADDDDDDEDDEDDEDEGDDDDPRARLVAAPVVHGELWQAVAAIEAENGLAHTARPRELRGGK